MRFLTLLLKFKANPNFQDDYGRSPLLSLLTYQSSSPKPLEQAIALLLKYKADPNLKDKYKDTPLAIVQRTPKFKKLAPLFGIASKPITQPAARSSLPPHAAAPTSLAINEGEISLTGPIASIDADNQKLVMKATSFGLPNGRSKVLSVPKGKTVSIGDATSIHTGDSTDKIALGDLKEGVVVTVVGTDSGVLAAREIVISDK